ncbi:MAG: YhdH/YhfP family quinone oxidoreductase [Nevskiales bacterium]
MSDFKALRVHQTDAGTESRFDQISVADLTEGEVVIKTRYSSLNYKDALAVSGKGKIMRRFPLVAGIDGAGVVESSSDDRFKPGDEVLVTGNNVGEALDGGLGERMRIPADFLVSVPSGLSLRESMMLGTAGFTAGLAVQRMLDNNQTPDMGPIVVTGPTGGVGSIAVDILSNLGFEVAALTGKADAQADYLKTLGASQIIDRNTLDFGKRPLEKAVWAGAVDNLGGDTLAYLTRTVGLWGNIASIGLAQSHKLETTVMPFILRGANLLGIHSVETPMPLRQSVWNKLAGEWKPRNLDMIACHAVALDDVPAFCDQIMAGTVTGRAVVEI